jgi:hypothetical protein
MNIPLHFAPPQMLLKIPPEFGQLAHRLKSLQEDGKKRKSFRWCTVSRLIQSDLIHQFHGSSPALNPLLVHLSYYGTHVEHDQLLRRRLLKH